MRDRERYRQTNGKRCKKEKGETVESNREMEGERKSERMGGRVFVGGFACKEEHLST